MSKGKVDIRNHQFIYSPHEVPFPFWRTPSFGGFVDEVSFAGTRMLSTDLHRGPSSNAPTRGFPRLGKRISRGRREDFQVGGEDFTKSKRVCGSNPIFRNREKAFCLKDILLLRTGYISNQGRNAKSSRSCCKTRYQET